MKSVTVNARILAAGMMVAFGALLLAEQARYAKVIKAVNIKIEN